MITIPLSKQGKNAGKYEAIVDDCDADLAGFNWHCVLQSHTLYARRTKNEYMHRVILARILDRPLDIKEQVDHVNGDGLNNFRSNLRLATHSQNNMNSKKRRNNKAGFKGITKDNGKYRAQIKRNRRLTYLGTFDTPEEAHEAYCEAAKEYFGEFANDG